MVDVFISYSRTDLEAVTRLAQAVEAEGYDVWWDADLPPHLSYGDVITAKIGMAKAAIVVWSKGSVSSEWVRAEADMARNQKKLVQTALDSVMPPLPFNQIQFAEIGDWRGEADHPGWRKVKASLAELCSREQASDRRPIRSEALSGPVRSDPIPPPARASKWPLYAGIAVGAIALLLAARMVIRENRQDRMEAAAQQAALATPPVQQSPGASQPLPVAPQVTPEEAGLVPGIEVLPFSSDRLLTDADIAPLNRAQLWIARNEIFARHGRRFRDPRLVRWFSRFAWYQPSSFDVSLSPQEQRNVALILAQEARLAP